MKKNTTKKIVSWNVNGLRALHRQGYWKWIEETQPDILCLQEIKAQQEELPDVVKNPEAFEYHAYFNSSRERKGYSGVALYTKEKPRDVHYDVLPKDFNTEGRLIEAHFGSLVIITVYVPNGRRDKKRLEFKLDYHDHLLAHVEELRAQGKSVIFCGDLNVAHQEIDLARPKPNETKSGFLPEERAWMDQVIDLGYIDTFRHFYPDKKEMYSYWDQITRARERNVGWRIDYIIASGDLQKKIHDAHIHADVYGSDHCPVSLDITI